MKRIEIEHSKWRCVGAYFRTGDDERRHCSLVLRLPHWYIALRLPPIIPPYREKHVAQYWDAATIERMGRNWYWNVDPREFGVTVSDGYLSVRYGRQANSSLDDKQWGYFLPWKQLRMVRHSLYGLNGEEVARLDLPMRGRKRYDSLDAARSSIPKVVFRFRDYDGEEIQATSYIEEREWHRGDRWCKWLSLFYKPQVRRSLELAFSKEVGPEKGSWKGGTVGHSIEMRPGELHAQAFTRYCLEHKLTPLGTVAPATSQEPRHGA
jgi:hypothetical protein